MGNENGNVEMMYGIIKERSKDTDSQEHEIISGTITEFEEKGLIDKILIYDKEIRQKINSVNGGWPWEIREQNYQSGLLGALVAYARKIEEPTYQR